MARATANRSATTVPFWRRRRFNVLSRSMAAIFGGYSLAASGNVLMALALPVAPGQAVIASTLIAIVLGALAPLWAFATDRVWKAWLGIVGPALMMLLLASIWPRGGQ